MKELIRYLAESLASRPELIEISEGPGKHGPTISLKVDQSDLNVIIGKQGRSAKAMRTLMAAAAPQKGGRRFLEISEAGAENLEAATEDHEQN